MQQFKKFKDVFGRSLGDFWIDNTKGLDVEKFRAAVLTDHDSPFLEAVKAQFGREGTAIVRKLMPKAPKPTPALHPPPTPAQSIDEPISEV